MPRLSLTKSQLETPVAIDLLQLLQSITADGKLTEVEIGELSGWLRQHEHEPLPAIEYLSDVVRRVLEDGKVSAEEQVWLQKAVETVLPTIDRQEAMLRRREAVAAKRREAKEEKEKEPEEAQLAKPVESFDVMVAGVYYDNRQDAIANVEEGDPITLGREPDNPYSKSAILFLLDNGRNIGYMPEVKASELAPLIDRGATHSAGVKKVLEGGRGRVPVIWGDLYSPDSIEGKKSPVVPFRGVPPGASPSSIPTVRRGPTTLSPQQPNRGLPGGLVLFLVLLGLLGVGLVILRGCLLAP